MYMYASDGSGCRHSNLQSSTVEILENDFTMEALKFVDTTETLPLNRHYVTTISADNVIGITNSTGIQISESMQLST